MATAKKISSQREVLERFITSVRKKYVDALQEVSTTGKTIKSIETQVTNNSATIRGGHWLHHVDYGRGPAKGGGDGSFYNAIKQWIVKKDSFNLSTKQSLHTAARRLQWRINKYGTKGFGRSRQILDSVNTTYEERQLAKDLGSAWLASVASSVGSKRGFKFLKVSVGRK